MTLLEYIRSWIDTGEENLFIVSVLRKDIRDSFQDMELKTYYKNFGRVALLIGADFNLVVITKRSEITTFYCDDLNEDDSYLILKYGKILLEEI